MKPEVKRLTTTAVLAALALALSVVEGFLPPLPIPGARLGLANVVIMYALAEVSVPSAIGITVIKVLFALFRGPVACMMSAGGSVLALIAMILLRKTLHRRFSFVGLGILGAAAHNGGQLFVSALLLGNAMWYYAPLLLLMAIPAGALTGIVLNVTYPHLRFIPKSS